MKKNFIAFIIALAIGGSLVSCEREIEPVAAYAPVTANQAQLKIVHASAYAVNTPMQLKVNDQRVSNNITYSTPFPSGGLNTGGLNFPWFLAVNPGTVGISMAIPQTNSHVDSVVRFNGNVTLEAGKSYTAFIADTGTNSTVVLVTDDRTRPTDSSSVYKFVNLIPNQSVDFYFDTVKLASNVAYKSVTPTFSLKTNATGVFRIRAANAAPTATPLATYTTTGSYTVPNRLNYTIYSRGYAGATGTRAPALSLTQN